jgi:lipid-A-disaccharide synthase
MSRPVRVAISAGEASGDRLGAELARALRELRPDVEVMGMGGPEMRAAGVRVVQDAADVAVVGIVEVFAHLPEIRAAMGRLESMLRADRPDVLVPIDFPDFNLRLAARARKADVDVCYFVSPQVWAWRRGRLRSIRALVRRMLVLFPFEVEFYERAGVPVTFVGHPVVERVKDRAPRFDLLRDAGLDPERPVVALAPGSRRGEIDRVFPVMLDAARRLLDDRPGLQFLVSKSGTVPDEFLDSIVEAHGPRESVRIREGDYPAILTGCAAGAVASGTATLEAAMAGLPMVVAYRMAPVTYWIARAFVRIEHVAMPNLVAGRRVVPERIQGECTGVNIAADLAAYLDEPARVDRVRRDLAEVRARLGGPGACARAAEAVLELADESRRRRVSG